jgi:exopolysaccharide biosynthesis predicted pyruvyltransferase EpsI
MSHGLLDLKNKINEISQHVVDKNNCVLIDYPFYFNVGDLLIFKGTLAYFEQAGIQLKAAYSLKSYSTKKLKKHVDAQTTIFLQGGGNFGDLYPAHQKIRETIIANFPNNKIILLPQSVCFESEIAQQRSAEIFKQHPNVVLFARDEISLKILKQFSTQTFLMPDMAHYLYGIINTHQIEPQHEVLYFFRQDKEQNPAQELYLKHNPVESIDWENLIDAEDMQLHRKLRKHLKWGFILPEKQVDEYVYQAWSKRCDKIIEHTCKLFLSHQRVVTSRLHAHILSSILEIPSTILDNSYKKNSLYFASWTSQLDIHELAQPAT